MKQCRIAMVDTVVIQAQRVCWLTLWHWQRASQPPATQPPATPLRLPLPVSRTSGHRAGGATSATATASGPAAGQWLAPRPLQCMHQHCINATYRVAMPSTRLEISPHTHTHTHAPTHTRTRTRTHTHTCPASVRVCVCTHIRPPASTVVCRQYVYIHTRHDTSTLPLAAPVVCSTVHVYASMHMQ